MTFSLVLVKHCKKQLKNVNGIGRFGPFANFSKGPLLQFQHFFFTLARHSAEFMSLAILQ